MGLPEEATEQPAAEGRSILEQMLEDVAAQRERATRVVALEHVDSMPGWKAHFRVPDDRSVQKVRAGVKSKAGTKTAPDGYFDWLLLAHHNVAIERLGQRVRNSDGADVTFADREFQAALASITGDKVTTSTEAVCAFYPGLNGPSAVALKLLQEAGLGGDPVVVTDPTETA